MNGEEKCRLGQLLQDKRRRGLTFKVLEYDPNRRIYILKEFNQRETFEEHEEVVSEHYEPLEDLGLR